MSLISSESCNYSAVNNPTKIHTSMLFKTKQMQQRTHLVEGEEKNIMKKSQQQLGNGSIFLSLFFTLPNLKLMIKLHYKNTRLQPQCSCIRCSRPNHLNCTAVSKTQTEERTGVPEVKIYNTSLTTQMQGQALPVMIQNYNFHTVKKAHNHYFQVPLVKC